MLSVVFGRTEADRRMPASGWIMTSSMPASRATMTSCVPVISVLLLGLIIPSLSAVSRDTTPLVTSAKLFRRATPIISPLTLNDKLSVTDARLSTTSSIPDRYLATTKRFRRHAASRLTGQSNSSAKSGDGGKQESGERSQDTRQKLSNKQQPLSDYRRAITLQAGRNDVRRVGGATADVSGATMSGGAARYLQVLLVTDDTVVKFHKGAALTQSYLLTQMSIVNGIFRDPSLGEAIEMQVVKLMIIDETTMRQLLVRGDGKKTLERFCQWSSKYRPSSSSSHGNTKHTPFDVALYLTKQDFGPAGYAPVTGMCKPERSCAVIRDDGPSSAFVIAHEIGHIIGMTHDGEENKCDPDPSDGKLMAPAVQSNYLRFYWTECSRKSLRHYLPLLNCLHDKSPANETLVIPPSSRLHGQSWSLDDQCRQEFGALYSFCTAFDSQDPCLMLWCSSRENVTLCRTKRAPPLPGTTCGRSKWCINGSCIPVTATPSAISKAAHPVVTKTSPLLFNKGFLPKGQTASSLRMGCDGVRYSAKTNDQCGVCGGRGTSCRKVSATFDRALAAREYHLLLELPENARQVAIREKLGSPHLAHYLAMKGSSTAGTSHWYLIGGGSNRDVKYFIAEGANFTYDNSARGESLLADGPLSKPLQVMIYSLSGKLPTRIQYEYVVGVEPPSLAVTAAAEKLEENERDLSGDINESEFNIMQNIFPQNIH